MFRAGRIYIELRFMVFWEKPFKSSAVWFSLSLYLIALLNMSVVSSCVPDHQRSLPKSDFVFAENLSWHFYGSQRGDIVIAKSQSDPKSNICKRVIGLQGDKIFPSSSSDFFKSHSYMRADHVWLKGDNLQKSTDSGNCGPVPHGLLGGHILRFGTEWFWILSDSPNSHRFSDD